MVIILSIYIILFAFLPLIHWLNPELGNFVNKITLISLSVKAGLTALYYLVLKGRKWKLSG